MELAHVELQADDGEHEDGEEEQQPDLQQRHHGLHDGLEHHLQTCGQSSTAGRSGGAGRAVWGGDHGKSLGTW